MLDYSPSQYTGRRVIYTDAEEITKENVGSELKQAMLVHTFNRHEEDYLYWYRRGYQPILDRTKEVRKDINNKIRENHADQIINFKTGYSLGKPITYSAHTDNRGVTSKIATLNDYMRSENAHQKNKTLGDWCFTCGVGYKMALPDDPATREADDEAPFSIFILDPRYTFVVYSSSVDHRPVFACTYIVKTDGKTEYTIYTKNSKFILDESCQLVSQESTVIGIPIIEYPLNSNHLGILEPILDLLDAINRLDSNRLDGIEQYVQALLKFHNCDISSDDYEKLLEQGVIKFKDIDPSLKADIEYITCELSQADTQTVKDDLYQNVLEIVGMPNRNGGSSTSDTGAGVILRDGWSDCEARAEDFEQEFRASEREFLKLILKMCDTLSDLSIKMSDIEINFTRRNYENIVSKSNVLIQMLSNNKIAPQLAFEYCNMFPDPVKAWQISQKYADEQRQEQMEMLNMASGIGDHNDDGNDPNDGKNPIDGTWGGDNRVGNQANDANKQQIRADKDAVDSKKQVQRKNNWQQKKNQKSNRS